MVGGMQATTKEAPPVEDIIVEVGYIMLRTQHVDLNTTLQPNYWNQVAPLAPPFPDLPTRPALVLTPNVSKEQADKDIEIKLTNKLTTLKQSRSLTRRMINL
jgi:hypothetical protein